MISDELVERRRRDAYDAFINHHIEYQPLKSRIYSICYPDGEVRPSKPPIGWTRAEAVRDKFYFDEIQFYVHMYVAKVFTRSDTVSTSECKEHFVSNSDKTFTLVKVLGDRLKEYLKPKIDLCSKCGKEGIHVCSRCKLTHYCSSECQKGHWKDHKLICKAPSPSK